MVSGAIVFGKRCSRAVSAGCKSTVSTSDHSGTWFSGKLLSLEVSRASKTIANQEASGMEHAQ